MKDIEILNFLKEFILNNASAVFGILGSFGGGIISFSAAWMLRKRDFNFRLWEKLLDRRIKAHESLISMALEMRVMVAWGDLGMDGEVARSPQIMTSRANFENWFRQFTLLTKDCSTWLSTEAKRELNFVQDYLVTLFQWVAEADSKEFLNIGQIIRQDFIDLSSTLEKKAFSYFSKDLRKLKLNDLEEWHKYDQSVTEERLTKTALLINRQQIADMIRRNGDS